MITVQSISSSSSSALNKVMLLLLFMFVSPAVTLIVPQELPSILSLVYSNIPPIKKGTDSRVGFGFRLGEHADFQVLMELGPQKETKPIGDQDDNNNSFNKRQVNKDEQFAQLQKQMRLKLKQLQRVEEKRQKQQANEDEATSKEGKGSSWLESWSQNINTNEKKLNLGFKKPPTVNEESLKQLQLLYKLATTEGSIITKVDPKPKSVDSFEVKSETNAKSKQKITKELMDVRLDDDE